MGLQISAAYPGSPRGTVKWSFPGQSTDLLNFQVTVKTDGRDQITKEAAPTQRQAEIDGLHPLARSTVTVEAVYKDEFRTNTNVEFSSEGVYATNPCVSSILDENFM